MADLTSERIAKDLKGGGYSSQDKIKTACKAWTDNSIFFPNKDDFLFEWICSAFAKPNLNNPKDSCFQLDYWQLFSDLLEHYDSKLKSNEKKAAPVIHSNLMKCISTLLEYLYSKNAGNIEDKVSFLAAINRFTALLFSEAFKTSYRPSFEQVSSTVDRLLTCFQLQIDTCLEDESNMVEKEALSNLCLIAITLLRKYDAQIIMAANQRKIFLSIVEKSLVLFLSVRRRIKFFSQAKYTAEISTLITNIICHILFHVDTVLEFTSILKEASLTDSSTTQSNYVAKLFETLQTMADNKADTEMILDVI
ncbi:hypothetical protein BDF20DRAFT_218802 [Mycotypha africana]|uniref:uncharacterized protein n=1 Tax=Mycotypha africana TaxID=64632 RepID=UPI0023009544|nr:uncharacterized protein BDF20DRAFT_218802 [Mycotypha africana]KAI8967508.1 hypothetical protein BDF20DRAFT_218802 [Mycotypha africana]